jgi:NAD(P)-dependent dehydrogenase (short-subunit alcohol dehydrogenase family)
LKPILLDVTKPDQIATAIETVSKFVGDWGLYGLFNNAGIGINSP